MQSFTHYIHYTLPMTTIRIATQNIQWGGDPAPGGDGMPRLTRLMPHLSDLDADLLVLTEYKSGIRGDELRDLLHASGYPQLYHGFPPTPYSLGTAIAARVPVVAAQIPIPSAMDPWRCTGVNYQGIDIFGFYFPLKDMPAYWDWVLANAKELVSREAVLIGDFNTGKHFVDEEADEFSCSDKHTELEKIGFIDTWRAANPDDRGSTWYSSANRGFRLDYIWASPSVLKQISAIRHNHDARNAGNTDHSAVIAEISFGKLAS
jgi:exodeoxyribonuclease III